MIEVFSDWLLAYWAHGIVLCATTLLVARTCVRHPSSRTVLWRIALFAPPFTAAASLALHAPDGPRALSLTAPLRAYLAPRWSRRLIEVREVVRGSEPMRRTIFVRDPLTRGAGIAISGFALAAMALGGLAFASRRRVARRVLAGRTNLRHDGDYVLSSAPALSSPVALGGREICIPARGFFTLTEGEQRSVLLHERAHLERADPAWLDGARAVAALAWWQPLNRLVLGALCRDAEQAADDDALAHGADPRSLVTALAHFAASIERGMAPGGAGIAGDDSPLVERAQRILAGGHVVRRGVPRGLLFGATVALLATLVLCPRPSVAGLSDASAPAARRATMVTREVEAIVRHTESEQPSSVR